jgi:hypothetical protein
MIVLSPTTSGCGTRKVDLQIPSSGFQRRRVSYCFLSAFAFLQSIDKNEWRREDHTRTAKQRFNLGYTSLNSQVLGSSPLSPRT